jgi:succinate dehydrogenase / fumarate reductase membrane anchor subunit
MERVTAVTSFGRNGLYDWLFQRISAVVLAAYFLFIFVYIVTNPGLTYEQWNGLFSSLGMRTFSMITLVMTLAHVWIGLWGVLTDYVTVRLMGNKAPAMRLILQLLIFLVMAVVVIVGIDVLWRF